MDTPANLMWFSLKTHPHRLSFPGDRVLLADMNTKPPEITVATLLIDNEEEQHTMYWQDEHNGGQQWEIHEKWTHWASLPLPKS